MTQAWSILKHNNQNWQIDGVDVLPLAARFGTPLYVYSAAYLRTRFQNYFQPAGAREKLTLHYAVKANSNLSILKLLADEGAGFDIVSIGELERVLLAGGAAEKIVFSGVGKTEGELRRAVAIGIGCINVESVPELQQIEAIARELGTRANIALRVNPNIDAQTHPYISTGMRENKFGIPIERVRDLYREMAASEHFNIVGVSCHIGSQVTTLSPFAEAADAMLTLADDLVAAGIPIRCLDMGGGLGIATAEQTNVPAPAELVQMLLEKLADRPYQLHLQPGRSIVGNAGILLTQTLLEKQQGERDFVVIDAAMNDYIRPALYQATPAMRNLSRPTPDEARADIVGPVCESGDTFAKQYPLAAKAGDIVALAGVGAYGFAMSSHYNSRPRAAEILIDGGEAILIRERETLADLWRQEQVAGFAR